MKNITFSAQEEAIENARKIAQQKHRTLNELFREWLEDINRQEINEHVTQKLASLWKQTSYLRVGKKLSREVMNER